VERGGAIKVVQPGSTTPATFLNIGSRIVAGGEQGLLGLAFHPGYANNGRFFVFYTRASDGAIVIAEYKVSATDTNQGDFASERVLLSWAHPSFANHNGGMVAFSPVDHFLYVAAGDGGSANDPNSNAQNINTFLGKILRINVDPANTSLPYESPSDNPYFGPAAGLDEIFAIGMRNPWRFSFDRLDGSTLR
jgi:glucose/arabinose dehydrogenase